MFKITPIQDEKQRDELFEKYGILAREGYFSYLMFNMDDGEPMGISQFDVRGECGYISDLRDVGKKEDFEAMFILGRQTMNFIDLCGAHLCEADTAAGDARLLHAIGFRESDGVLTVDMNGMFDGHCDGHAVDLNK